MIREHSSGVAGILDNDPRPHDIGIHLQYSDSTRIYLYQEFFHGKDRTGFLTYKIGPAPDFGVIIYFSNERHWVSIINNITNKISHDVTSPRSQGVQGLRYLTF